MSKVVCHITSAHSRYDTRIFLKECVSLANDGFNVTLIVNDNAPDELINGVNIASTKFKPKNRLQRFIKLRKHIYQKALEVNADIYHLHDPDLLPIANRLIKKGKKVIYDSHEDVPRQILSKYWIPKYIRKIVSYSFEQYENKISKGLTAIVVPTPHIEDRFKKINNSVYQICNFPLLSEFKVSKINSLRQGSPCYIGGISVERGIKQIVEATKRVNVELILCGGFVSDGLKSEITTSNQHVNYLGFLDRKGISNILQDANVGFVTLLPTPNHIDSYPIKMFEYMAAGLPVIASNFPLWKEIVHKYNCGICVDPSNVTEIEKALMYINDNPETANVMGKNGKKAVLENFNWGTQEVALINLYRSL